MSPLLITLIALLWNVCNVELHQPWKTPNTRPVIGIVAVDTNSRHGKTYIPVTYVSYLQQAGARVVPIRGGQPRDYYDQMISRTNGILFPGGSVPFQTSLYGRSVKYIYETALNINSKGDYFPLWGTCMGFQILCYCVAGANYLSPTDSANITWSLNFTAGAFTSRMFSNAPRDITNYLSTESITQNQHHYSILISCSVGMNKTRDKKFKSTKLGSFFNLLSTNKDRRGQDFVSSVEGKNVPFYGVQWHPEKNNFNWNPHYDINHGDHAVKVSQYMANFFVGEARKSNHSFPNSLSVAKNLIQNYKRVYFSDGSFFENYYID